jgi:hypothetical protein
MPMVPIRFFLRPGADRRRLAIVDLTPFSCRWPSSNPRDPATFRYRRVYSVGLLPSLSAEGARATRNLNGC